MRLKVPITGTVIAFDPATAKLDGVGVSGDPNDPVRIDIDLGNVSWRLVAIDLKNDLAEIEVSPGENIDVLKSGGNPANPEDWSSRATIPIEKQGFLDNAKHLIESHTKDELYALSSSKRLVKSAEVVQAYEKYQTEGMAILVGVADSQTNEYE